jgi:ribonuclease HI
MEIIHIYTDGSCYNNPGPGGWGVYIPAINKEIYGKAEETTNNKMELAAMKNAIEYILSNCITNDFKIQTIDNVMFQIHTDSNYVKIGWEKWMLKWKINGWKTSGNNVVKNKNIWMELSDLKQKLADLNIKYKLIWVKAHNGDEYNEHVDKIAKYCYNKV